MARFAIIDAGRVTNIIEADAATAQTLGAVPAEQGGIGWLFDGTTFTAPPPVAVDPAQRWEQIKALRDAKVQGGGYKVGTKWYHSDTFSRTQQIGLVMMGAGMPAGLQWKTMDGSFVAMTPTLAGQIFAAAAAQDAALFARAEALKQDANADINSGWPETFDSAAT